MPTFRYFGTIDDSFAILRDLCDRGLRVVVEPGASDDPKPRVFESVTDELMTILRGAPSFYLAGAFTRSQVQLERVTTLVTQGRLLQALVGRVGIVDDKSTLLPGDVSYQSKYRNPKTDQLEPASKELLAAYTLAALTIRNRCTRYSAEIFIAPKALSLVQQGHVAIDNR